MAIRILTKDAVENTNIDGARDCNFNSGRKSGIVAGALNQGVFFSSASNIIALDTCELRLCGHRIVIDAIEYISLKNIPTEPNRLSMIAQIIVDDDNNVQFDLFVQASSTALIQDNLDINGRGTFQLEIGKFTQNTDGTITDVLRTAELITGLSDGSIYIGNVITKTLATGKDASVAVQQRYDTSEKKNFTDFYFEIPTGENGDKVELRVYNGYLQWKYSKDTIWTNLLAVSEIANVDQTLSLTSTNAISNLAVAKNIPEIIWDGVNTATENNPVMIDLSNINIQNCSFEIEFGTGFGTNRYKSKIDLPSLTKSFAFFTDMEELNDNENAINYYIPISFNNMNLIIYAPYCLEIDFSNLSTISLVKRDVIVYNVTRIPNGVNYG